MIQQRRTKQDRIIEYIRAIDGSATPHEIAEKLQINPNTVTKLLSRLLAKGVVAKEARGLYCRNPIYGVGGSSKPVRVQNLTVIGSGAVVRDVDMGKSEVFEAPDVSGEVYRVRIVFGKKRNKITYTVKAFLGLDRYAFLMVHQYVLARIALRGYRDVLAWTVVNYELLEDFVGIKVDGAKCITLDAFDSMLIKVYEKTYGLRKEVRGSRPAQLNDLLSLTMGGISSYQLMQGVGTTNKDIELLTRAISGLANREYDNRKVMVANTEALTRLLDAMYNQGLVKPIQKKVAS